MHWLTILLIGVAANLDNLGVGIAYGVRKIKMPPLPNLLIAAMAFAFTWMSAEAGEQVARFLPARLASYAGGALLAAVGVWIMVPELWRARRRGGRPARNRPSVLDVLSEPDRADADRSGVISLRESLLLGTALGMNCLTNGLGAGLIGLHQELTSLSAAVFSYLALWAGTHLGTKYAAERLGGRATVAAGLLLILLGLHQL